MENRTTISGKCTAQRSNGEFCDAPSAPDMPFPICTKHAARVWRRVQDNFDAKKRDIVDRACLPERQQDRIREAEARKDAYAKQSVVYYVRIGDHIKIGTTTNVSARLSQLRCDRDNLLATEPGDRTLEQQRHREFAAERIGRRENFNPSPRLIKHIDQVREQHGAPVITGYLAVH